MVELKAGGYYMTRDGREIGPLERCDSAHYPFACGVEPTADCTVRRAVWQKDGTNYCERRLDIIGEIMPSEAVHHPTAASGAQREKMNALPYDLVPFQEIADAYSRVAEKGAEKYSAWNWSKGLARVQLIGSLLRHTFAYLRGEDFDKETGLSHTDHILWNAVALSHNVHHGLEDGRRIEPNREYKA